MVLTDLLINSDISSACCSDLYCQSQWVLESGVDLSSNWRSYYYLPIQCSPAGSPKPVLYSCQFLAKSSCASCGRRASTRVHPPPSVLWSHHTYENKTVCSWGTRIVTCFEFWHVNLLAFRNCSVCGTKPVTRLWIQYSSKINNSVLPIEVQVGYTFWLQGFSWATPFDSYCWGPVGQHFLTAEVLVPLFCFCRGYNNWLKNWSALNE